MKIMGEKGKVRKSKTCMTTFPLIGVMFVVPIKSLNNRRELVMQK